MGIQQKSNGVTGSISIYLYIFIIFDNLAIISNSKTLIGRALKDQMSKPKIIHELLTSTQIKPNKKRGEMQLNSHGL